MKKRPSEVRRHLGRQVFDVVVPRSVRLAEAPSYGTPAVVWDPSSKGAQAYAAFAQEILAREHTRHEAEIQSVGERT